jgi:hypothetical protein
MLNMRRMLEDTYSVVHSKASGLNCKYYIIPKKLAYFAFVPVTKEHSAYKTDT